MNLRVVVAAHKPYWMPADPVYLPVQAGAVLVVISIFITMIGGMIPARKAAKKDPVIALRTE